MNWTEEEVEAEVSRQEQQAACKEWMWNEGSHGADYYWAHICGQKYYQLDQPSGCYLGCEEE